VKSEAKKFDTVEDVKNACGGQELLNLGEVEKITLGGNSYGFVACEWLAG
jgi:Ran GTPase-activating protein (RanGAP) involved in mRNA processing and transport